MGSFEYIPLCGMEETLCLQWLIRERVRDARDVMCLGPGSLWAIMQEHKAIAPALIPQSHGLRLSKASIRIRKGRHHRN